MGFKEIMSWKGKLCGSVAGFAMGGPLGAVIGAVLGHQIDKATTFSFAYTRLEEKKGIQDAFFSTTFSVMGHLAKADGVVSKAEINLATHVMEQMRLSTEQRQQAMHLFEQGKKSNFPLIQTLQNFQQQCGYRQHLLLMFLEIQLQAAMADGNIHTKEEAVLSTICQQFEVSPRRYEIIKRRLFAQQRFQQHYQQQPFNLSKIKLNDAYDTLGVKVKSSDAELKKAYRSLVSQHHPDKLLAKGLPEEMMTLAKEKTQQITKAYEIIKASRQH